MEQEETVQELSAQDIALKLLRVVGEEAMSSKKLMLSASIDEDYQEVVKDVLRALAAAGKVKKVKTEGGVRWAAQD